MVAVLMMTVTELPAAWFMVESISPHGMLRQKSPSDSTMPVSRQATMPISVTLKSTITAVSGIKLTTAPGVGPSCWRTPPSGGVKCSPRPFAFFAWRFMYHTISTAMTTEAAKPGISPA